MNVCGHPNSSQMRSHVSKLGAGLDLPVLPNADAEAPRTGDSSTDLFDRSRG
jgi:hypothetical protein